MPWSLKKEDDSAFQSADVRSSGRAGRDDSLFVWSCRKIMLLPLLLMMIITMMWAPVLLSWLGWWP